MRRLLRRQVLVLLALLTFVLGASLIFLRYRLDGQVWQEVLLSLGATLMTFGVTTMLAAWFSTMALETALLGQINDEMGKHVENARASMERTAKTFEASINDFNPLVGNCTKYGLINVYLTRADALSDFAPHLVEELKDASSSTASTRGYDQKAEQKAELPPKARLWIVASSMKGIRATAAGDFDGPGLLAWAGELAAKEQIDLKLLLTHPRYANLRSSQEQRLGDAIGDEIRETLAVLKDYRVPITGVRFVAASPTVFAIATRVQMLLNPYPYSAEAFRSFTLRVRKVHLAPSDRHTAIHRDMFEQYENRHFVVPWDNGLPLVDYRGVPELKEEDPLAPLSNLPALPRQAPTAGNGVLR